MPSPWIYPSTTNQFAEASVHIPWLNVDSDFTAINLVLASKPLLHIANPLVNDLKMKTYYVVFNGFAWEDIPNTISGFEIYINVRRVGRVVDDTVQLWNGSLIGENKATAEIANIKTYGSSTDLWGLTGVQPSDLNSNFGVALRYQSHPSYPHSTAPNIEHVQIRVW